WERGRRGKIRYLNTNIQFSGMHSATPCEWQAVRDEIHEQGAMRPAAHGGERAQGEEVVREEVREEVLEEKKVRVLQELSILVTLDHPFIVNLQSSFQVLHFLLNLHKLAREYLKFQDNR